MTGGTLRVEGNQLRRKNQQRENLLGEKAQKGVERRKNRYC